mmetsp:Transcript_25298/g.42685  ORF Transcript_25298/g.42685 Transcript_25298/m.42685 type:complete len:361 (+) Transcript_25298:45-1127(+)|eukprot:CAMPEP_0114421674 /NCGR_PEP_ID=MMETSP0103-20121206/5205_1 /TAXON_ID=37642 ORGANISM="Paraphysomonas imperforata, Strain PA2" /NCGR_SAMPLE_ID=MMETSP0103 /ASSEMBLY_ACC=CAM_ASM_000201 /LENGTH=360 /DNA_ID=CAMNT_0001590213 /DNA_START=51 /DNA_END=1133 /DNA_ORIENTATION=-
MPGEISALERATDDLERRLKDKIERNTNFAGPESNARKLEHEFKFFDTNGSGAIDFQEFFAAMTHFNFVGVQRETEALFNRYDEDASGDLDYKEFAYHLFGIGGAPKMDVNSKNVVEKVKARIIEKDGASGIHNVTRILRRMDTDGSGSLDQNELMKGLNHYGIKKIPPRDMKILFNYFDRDHSGHVSVDEFLRGLKSGMSFDRKQLVRQAFNILDATGDGVVGIDDVIKNYDFSKHPNVIGGVMSTEEAAEEMLQAFEQGGDVDGVVTWAEFLDYYKGISMSIDDDQYFELMIRNSWHISGGSGAAENSSNKRVLVVHSDGEEEIVEIKNDLGLNIRDRDDVIQRLERQGVQDIYKVKI